MPVFGKPGVLPNRCGRGRPRSQGRRPVTAIADFLYKASRQQPDPRGLYSENRVSFLTVAGEGARGPKEGARLLLPYLHQLEPGGHGVQEVNVVAGGIAGVATQVKAALIKG
jgi:hypothetical protein